MPVVNLPPEGLCRPRPSFGILSSYPPTACGLATFSAALASGMAVHDATSASSASSIPPDRAHERIVSSAS